MHAPTSTRPWASHRPLLALLLALTALALGSTPTLAAVPHNKAVPAYAEEQTILQLEQGRREPGLLQGASGIEHQDRHTLVQPGLQGEYGVILQRGGNTWRTLRNGPLATASAVMLLFTVTALIAFHVFRRSPPPHTHSTVPVQTLQRFTLRQRWVHWSAAIAFVVLAFSGLLILFGKKLLLPWMGHEVFAWLALVSKWGHNIAGPLFIVASVVMFITYLRHNHFQRVDLAWLRAGGGMFSGKHVPAPYFNAGEKLWFWLGVTALGLLMATSGLMLNFPYLGEVGAVQALTRYQLQLANVAHLVGAALYIAMGLGHIYLGTIGSPGAWRAMAHGDVSAQWAHEHHSLWYDQVQRETDVNLRAPRAKGH